MPKVAPDTMKFTGYDMDTLVATDGGDPDGQYRSYPNGANGQNASSNAAAVTAMALLLIAGSAAFLM